MGTPEFIKDLRGMVGNHPLWLSGATAVTFRDGPRGEQTLLVKRADNGEWSPVMGIIDPGEEPGDAAVRESAEEAGVVVGVVRLAWMYVTDPVVYGNGDVTQYIDHTFRCRWISGDPYPVDGEASQAAWFDLDDLPSMPDDYAERIAVAAQNLPECRLGPLTREALDLKD